LQKVLECHIEVGKERRYYMIMMVIGMLSNLQSVIFTLILQTAKSTFLPSIIEVNVVAI